MQVTTKAGKEDLTCKKGEELVPLGTFSSIDKGCLCKDKSVHNTAYCYSLGYFHTGCESVDEYAEEDIQQIPCGKDKLRLCGSRVVTYRKVALEDKCPTDYPVSCGNSMCVKTVGECPINEHAKGVFKYDPKSLKKPIVSFSLEPEIPCWQANKQMPFDTKAPFYPLFDTTPNGCGDTYKQDTAYFERV